LPIGKGFGKMKQGRSKFMKALKTAGKWGSILVLIALLIALVKQIISFIGFLMTVIKILLVLAFVALIFFIGYLVFRSLQEQRKNKEESA
jgi:fatty acid desaturase